ncbi:helix-turn-helix domain-containing protein, partial [Virgibacillus halodenitrificans]|nr:helix-turn-helix domain-containing protein [Virgibacillus halodenitrificans]
MNQSVIKALKLLDLFTEENPELTLKDIADRSRLPKPTAYRMLTALEVSGFLYKTKETEHDSKYRLGLKLLELGQLVSDNLEVRGIALPFMKQLAEEINEVIHLVIVNGSEATYIEKVESTRALRLYTRIGKSSPL